tara:strand:+ start:141 stop:254 length:114 start_codon:yes stop_codon:yes gene_type:complete
MKIEFGAFKVEMDEAVGLVAVLCYAIVAMCEMIVKVV